MLDTTQIYEVMVIALGAVGLPLMAYIARSVQRVNIALFGLRGDNGLVNDVKDLKGWQVEHELHHATQGDDGRAAVQ